MGLLTAVALDVSALLSLALAAAWLLRAGSAATRHWILATAVVCAAAMPAVELAAPPWPVPVPEWLAPTATSTLTLTSARIPDGPSPTRRAAPAPPTPSLLVSRTELIASVWLAGTGVGFAVLLASLLRLSQLGRRARVITDGPLVAAVVDAARSQGLSRDVRLLQSHDAALVVTWGFVRPRVLLPAGAEDWSAERQRVVLSHELAHVRRGDWCLHIVASLVQCLYWFNPLVWLACRQLRLESEHACDNAVLTAGVGRADYASHLLAVAREAVRVRHGWMHANAIAHPSTLERRIRAMLNQGLNRRPLSRPMRYTTIAGLVALTGAIAAARVSAQSDSTLTDVGLAETAVPGLGIEDQQPPATATTRRAAAAETRGTADGAAAQNGPAVVTGTLYDQLGGYLPGVLLTLTNARTAASLTGTTDRNGQFEFRDLPAGTYELVTALPGFATVTNQITLAAGTSVVRRITLPIGSLQETVSVSCRAGSRDATPLPAPLRGGRGGPAPVGGRGSVPFSGGIGGQIKVPSQVARVNPSCPSTILLAADTEVILIGRIGIDGYLSDLRHLDAPSDRVVNRVVQREVEVFDNLGRRRVVPQRTFTTVAAPEPEFVEAARVAVSQWRYTPTLLNGVPVEVDVRIVIRYHRE